MYFYFSLCDSHQTRTLLIHHNMNYVLIKNYSNRKFKFKIISLICLIFLKLSSKFLDFVWCASDRFNHNTKKTLLIGESHSMTRANPNESEWLVINTTAASKYLPMRPRICINWNTPFQIVTYGVNLTSQYSYLEVILLSKLGSERGDFYWCRFWASYVCALMLR